MNHKVTINCSNCTPGPSASQKGVDCHLDSSTPAPSTEPSPCSQLSTLLLSVPYSALSVKCSKPHTCKRISTSCHNWSPLSSLVVLLEGQSFVPSNFRKSSYHHSQILAASPPETAASQAPTKGSHQASKSPCQRR